MVQFDLLLMISVFHDLLLLAYMTNCIQLIHDLL